MAIPTAESPGAEQGDRNDGEKNRMERVIERIATGLGNGVGALAETGALFVVFAMLWLAFGAALIWSQGSVDTAWQAVRELPLLVQGLVWLLFLPVMIGMWVWESSWSLLLRLGTVLSVAVWTLLVFPKPWK